jgi:hypothetical protein
MNAIFRNLWKSWENFWFAPMDLIPLALFRIFFGVSLFSMYVIRAFDFKLFYTDQGMMTAAGAKLIFPDYMTPHFYLFGGSDHLSLALYVLFMIMLALFIFGALSRVLVFILLILHLGFIQRNYTVVYGADLMATCFLFYFMLTRSHWCLSVWNLFFRDKREGSLQRKMPSLSRVGFRLLQMQVCAIYFFSGLGKVRGASWWDGSAVWRVLGDRLLVTYDLSFLKNFPFLIVLLTYSTLIFEVYFVAAMLNQKIRYKWLLFGVGLHIGIAVIMNLPFFSMIMISTYILFVDPADLRKWIEKSHFLKRRFGSIYIQA